MDNKKHWEAVYANKKPAQLTWYQTRPQHSLQMIEATSTPLRGHIIDVGGGNSLLVDFLLEAGYTRNMVLAGSWSRGGRKHVTLHGSNQTLPLLSSRRIVIMCGTIGQSFTF